MGGLRSTPRRARLRGRAVGALSLAVALLLGCASEPPDVRDGLDGNVVVGDALPVDLGPDAGRLDADAEPDAGPSDAEPDYLGFPDASIDAGLDAGPTDGADAGDPCAPTPEATLTATAALAESARWSGRPIVVVGVAVRGPSSCSPETCPPDQACCGRCQAELSVDARLLLAPSACATPGCDGDHCGLACTPLDLGLEARHLGILRDDAPPRLELLRVLD